jgi:hypothetical protein
MSPTILNRDILTFDKAAVEAMIRQPKIKSPVAKRSLVIGTRKTSMKR